MYHLIFVVKIKNNMKLCIIGNSLSALTLASALVNEKIAVDVFFSEKKVKSNLTRTIGISKSNIEYFNANILNVEKFFWKLNKIEIYTDNLKNEKLLNFEDPNKYLFSIIKNSKLKEILRNNLNKNKFYKEKVFNEKINITKNYDLVINTDFNNLIMKKYFSKKIIKSYNSIAYTTIISHDKIENNTAVQIFTKKGPIAFLPISNSQTSIVFSIHNSQLKKNENIYELIKLYNLVYKINKFEKIELAELKSFNLRSYYKENVLAFGDLIHRIHPLAGQGFNMTIRDTMILMKIIKNKLSTGLPIDSSVNKEFERKSKHMNFIFSNSNDFIYEYFNFERKIQNYFLSKSVQIIGNYKPINNIFTKIADKGIFI